MSMTIECGNCTHRNTPTCNDCVVNFIINREPDEAVIVDVAEYAALKRLHSAGLISDMHKLAI